MKTTNRVTTRQMSTGYKTCRMPDMQKTLLELDKIVEVIRSTNGDTGLEAWVLWKIMVFSPTRWEPT